MKFPYVKLEGKFKSIIPVVLTNADHAIHTDALVDSGADRSIFHAEFAEAIGIDAVEEGEYVEFYGISGAPVRAYAHEVHVEIGGHRFGPVEIPFSRDLSPDSINILGQEDFFAMFRIKFTYEKKEISVVPN